ncbi:sensor domain-containing diguanylate cyclase [Noviherbaspirillum cavernae]|uniref:diguanylate cyclase n=1 Tax=Noviherbaspirillum cavernae TaxID=2320862 RepID=A0A418WVI7_9BURK|nr:diguanylate cyclase [Noviherbaspirillum cavernae]RJF96742.1 sensor domain-containing diguanylate cyclase [Noviherbaspirillum cavernae]
MKKLLQFGPILRMSIGIVSLILTLLLIFDALLHILPSERQQLAEVRRQVSTVLGGQINAKLAAGDAASVQSTVDQLAAITPDVRSIGVRKGNRLVIASRGHEDHWTSSWTGESTMTHVVVPVFTGKKRWGDIEVAFTDPGYNTLWGWLRQPSILVILLLSSFGLAGVYFYLRRALNYLDPSQAVPQRVRKAFDTLTEGVLILDGKGRIMLANAVFLQMNAGGQERIEGAPITGIGWLIAGLSRGAVAMRHPWDLVLRSNQTIQGKELTVTLPDGSARELRMNCSAINDGAGAARGCLVSFDDVTQLSDANARLQRTLNDLELSRDKIQEQNDELQKLANFDPLTGCLNRRAFFARAEPLFQKAVAGGGELICIMADIDFFKSFNDRYGHAVGDLVIQQVAGALGRSLRDADLLCRYGGEEFCIVVAGIDERIGREIAERTRARIDTECGPGVRSVEGLRITSSFGFAVLSHDRTCSSLSRLIELADEALYAAKKSGRNRVASVTGETLSYGEPPPQPLPAAAAAH